MAHETNAPAGDGLHVQFLPVNQAHAVMWHESLLRIFNSRAQAEDYVADLREQAAYDAYKRACAAESLNAHDLHM